MTYEQFLTASLHYWHSHNEQRYGQALFNYLFEVRPDLSERVRGSKLDPFYQDRIAWKFLAWVVANW